ncbi:MAG: amino acid adenylation domain-containing protein [Planctomycetaceae bacterium]|nr:amino acid adenylation domain-containing protein [Planctomycetaceae bacterium]
MHVIAHTPAETQVRRSAATLGATFPVDFRLEPEDTADRSAASCPVEFSVTSQAALQSCDILDQEAALCAVWLAVASRFSAETQLALLCLRTQDEQGLATSEVLIEACCEPPSTFAEFQQAIRAALAQHAISTDAREAKFDAGIRLGFWVAHRPIGIDRLQSLSLAAGDLTFVVAFDGGRLTAQLCYDARRFLADTVASIAESCRCYLNHALAHSQCAIDVVPMLSTEARRLVVDDFNATTTPYPRDRTLVDLFHEQVQRHGDRMAVAFRDEQLTYSELDARARRLAGELAAVGVGRDAPVAVCAPRSADLIVGLLGIIQAGGAYLAIDPTWPAERIEQLIRTCQPAAVLTTAADRVRYAALGLPTFAVDSPANDRPASLPVPSDPRSLAYISFTSGSTGNPKAVCIEQRSVVRLVRNAKFLEWSPDDVSLHHSPLPFDASTIEIWGPLLNGGCVALTPPGLFSLKALGRWIDRYRVTAIFLTSALFHAVVEEHLQDLRPLRYLMTGGDVMSLSHVRKVLTELPELQFIICYGPTENTTYTTTMKLQSVDDLARMPSVPLGYPISNSQVYLLDPRGEPVPIGGLGELFCGGDGVAREYWRQPELTAERFVTNPFGPGQLYRTGDIARWRPNGLLEFHGRRDRQLKIRGFRVELGEIEATLSRHPAIRQAAVIARTDLLNRKSVEAYVVCEASVGADELQFFLRERLPEFMLPASITILDRFPVTAVGKLDYKALASSPSACEIPRGKNTPEPSRF